jgi:hypothetical protein
MADFPCYHPQPNVQEHSYQMINKLGRHVPKTPYRSTNAAANSTKWINFVSQC